MVEHRSQEKPWEMHANPDESGVGEELGGGGQAWASPNPGTGNSGHSVGQLRLCMWLQAQTGTRQ